MKYITITLFLFLFVGVSIPAAHGQLFPDQPAGHVNDLAGFMSSAQVNHLEHKLRAYRDSTSNVIAILTVESLQGESPEYVAEQVFNTWRMWEGQRQNGVLMLASRQERAIRIEVGYGLEGAIPDILAGRIIQEILVPGFRQEQFGAAFSAASDQLMRLAAGEYEAIPMQPESNVDEAVRVFFILFLLIMFIVVMILRAKLGGTGGSHHIRRGGVIVMGGSGLGRGGFGGGFGRSGGFGGGGSFGGFSGGGGFGSGGGGASGGW
jgi:uncharacterized protein